VSGGSAERIVVTGATGFVGREVVRRLIEQHPEAHLILFVRARGAQPGSARAHTIIREVTGQRDTTALDDRVTVVDADVSEPRCGLDEATYRTIAAGTTRIIHSAATVYFAERLEESRRINVTGTVNMLELAEAAKKAGTLRTFIHVSTAYVSGYRTGLIREDELDVQQKFRNTYEQTKCEAEALVRRRQGDLPIVIARPSIVVGDSQTGITTSFKTVYWPLKVYASRRWRTVPGYPDTVIDLVPVDFVANGIVHLAFDDLAPGQCVHLSAGPEGSMTVGEVTKLASEMFKVKPVRFVNPSLFMTVVRPIVTYLARGSRRRILRDGHVYLPYFYMKMRFDTTVAERLLRPAGITPPDVRGYIERVFQYCLDSDWGNRPVPQKG
jgi:thioester reductase-like protein